MTQLFETQDQILTTSKFSDAYGELSVNKAVIDLHLKTPLSLPRNAQLFPENREMVGGFIFKALAKSGLMLVSEEFKYQRVTVDPEVCCVCVSPIPFAPKRISIKESPRDSKVNKNSMILENDKYLKNEPNQTLYLFRNIL